MSDTAKNTYFEKHKPLLDDALRAIKSRAYWSAYPENPSKKIYGETAFEDGENAFNALKNSAFSIPNHPGTSFSNAGEKSPFGFSLNISYPAATIDEVVDAAQAAMATWQAAGVHSRVGVCLEILNKINELSFTFAQAVQHTTGQSFIMAFQAGGPHAQDRALEAIAYAYDAMAAVPDQVRWEKPQGKNPPLVVNKEFSVVPRGVAVLVGVATFPTWNGYPGLFASLACGNPVIIKPHTAAILPLALTVRIAREVLKEAGFDPNLVTLLIDDAEHPVAKELCTRPEVKLIDFTGGSEFGNWLEKNCPQAIVYTEKSGVNAVIIDDFSDLKGMARNLSFTLSLYSGQMCTTPQNIFIPKVGIKTADGHKTFEEVSTILSSAIEKFLSDPSRAFGVLGAIQSVATLERITEANEKGSTVLKSKKLEDPNFPGAEIHTPALLEVEASDTEIYSQECFGPITYLVKTENTAESLALLRSTISEGGAITASVYSDSNTIIAETRKVCEEVGVALSVNLTGGLFVNQSAAFSDFHGTGANPAANAALTDTAFVAQRFRVVQTRLPTF